MDWKYSGLIGSNEPTPPDVKETADILTKWMLRGKRDQSRIYTARDRALFLEENHQKRGKTLEGLLNRLFVSFDVSVREAFTIQGVEGEGIITQIDGAIELDNRIYLVEMKWLKEKVGPGDVAQHLNRVMYRAGAGGIFISATDYTLSAQNILCQALSHRVHVAIHLQEIIYALEKESDLTGIMRAKVQAAI